jgi:hypothetical protein
VATPTIINPRLQQLYASWLAKRGGRRFPARADFDPIELRFILGNLILVDVVGKEKPAAARLEPRRPAWLRVDRQDAERIADRRAT